MVDLDDITDRIGGTTGNVNRVYRKRHGDGEWTEFDDLGELASWAEDEPTSHPERPKSFGPPDDDEPDPAGGE